MTELASRIGKRKLFGNLTWTRPGLEEEMQAQKAQGISFGNGHRLSTKWEAGYTDNDSEASSGNDGEGELAEVFKKARTPTGTPRKILRNRIAGVAHTTETQTSPGSLMERLGMGALPEAGSSATSEASSMDSIPLSISPNNDGNYPASNVSDLHSAVTGSFTAYSSATTNGYHSPTFSDLPHAASKSVNTNSEEADIIPGLTIAQPRSQNVVRLNSGEKKSESAARNSLKLVDDMRRLLVPLVVKKASQGSHPSSVPPTNTSDLAQKAHSVITDEICEEFIRRAIASVPSIEKMGRVPKDRPDDHATAMVVASRSPSPMPPGLGFTTKDFTSISTPNDARPPNDTDSGKIMPPSHPPPTAPRAMQAKEANRLRSADIERHDEDPISPRASPGKGRWEDSNAHAGSSRDRRRPAYPSSPSPRPASPRRSAPPNNYDYVARATRRRSRSMERSKESYRPTEQWRSRSPSGRRNRQSPPYYSRVKGDQGSGRRWRSPDRRTEERGREYNRRLSPPPYSRNAHHSPTTSVSSSRFLPSRRAKTKSRSRSRSKSLSPSRPVHQLPTISTSGSTVRKKAYSPIPRDGPPRGWTPVPSRMPPSDQYHKPHKYDSTTDFTPDSPAKTTDYGSRPRRDSGGSFNKGHSYHPYRRNSQSGRTGSPPPNSASPSMLSRRGMTPPSASASAPRFSETRPPRSPVVPHTYVPPPPPTYAPPPLPIPPYHPPIPDPRTSISPSKSAFEPTPVPLPMSIPGLPLRPSAFMPVYPLRDYNAKGEHKSYWDPDGQSVDRPIDLEYGSRAPSSRASATVDATREKTRFSTKNAEVSEIERVESGEVVEPVEADEVMNVDDWTPPGLTLAPTSPTRAKGNVATSSTVPVAPILSMFDQIVDEEQKPDIKELEKLVTSLKPPTAQIFSSSPVFSLPVPMHVDQLPGATPPPPQSVVSSRLQTPAPHQKDVEQAVPEPVILQEGVKVQGEEKKSSNGKERQKEDEGEKAQDQLEQRDERSGKGVVDDAAPVQARSRSPSSSIRPQDSQMTEVQRPKQGPDRGNDIAENSQSDVELAPPMEIGGQETEQAQATSAALSRRSTPSVAPPSRPVPGVWLSQQAGRHIIDQRLEIDEETALKWGLCVESSDANGANAVATGSGSASSGKPRAKPKVKLQVLCFLNDDLNTVDWRGDPMVLLTLQQTWPSIGDFVITLNNDTPSERAWCGTYLPYTDGTGPAVRMERYVHSGVNTFRTITIADVSRHTFIMLAQPVAPEPPIDVSPYDEYFAKLRDQLLDMTKNTFMPGISGSVTVTPLSDSEDD